MKKLKMLDLSKKTGGKKKSYHNDLPKPAFMMAFVGPSRSGKSNVIRNLLLRRDMYNGKFEYIFIFSNTLDLSGDFDEINSTRGTKVQKYNKFDEGNIKDIMEKQNEIIKKHGKSKTPDILIILDDVFDDEKFNRSNILKTLAFRGRHSKISTILSGQKLSMMSTSIRNNLTHLCFFRPGNYSELDRFLEENVEKYKRKYFSEIFKKVWEKPYSFIFIDYLNKDLKKRFRDGFSDTLNYEM